MSDDTSHPEQPADGSDLGAQLDDLLAQIASEPVEEKPSKFKKPELEVSAANASVDAGQSVLDQQIADVLAAATAELTGGSPPAAASETPEEAAEDAPAEAVAEEVSSDPLADQLQALLDEAKEQGQEDAAPDAVAAVEAEAPAGAAAEAASDEDVMANLSNDDIASMFETAEEVIDAAENEAEVAEAPQESEPASAQVAETPAPAEVVAEETPAESAVPETMSNDDLEAMFQTPDEVASDSDVAAEAEAPMPAAQQDDDVSIEDLDNLIAGEAEESLGGDFETIEQVIAGSEPKPEAAAEPEPVAEVSEDTEPTSSGDALSLDDIAAMFESPEEVASGDDRQSASPSDGADAAAVAAELDSQPERDIAAPVAAAPAEPTAETSGDSLAIHVLKVSERQLRHLCGRVNRPVMRRLDAEMRDTVGYVAAFTAFGGVMMMIVGMLFG